MFFFVGWLDFPEFESISGFGHWAWTLFGINKISIYNILFGKINNKK